MKNKWSEKFDKCIQCGKTETKHHAHGLCRNCYEKTPERKEVRKEYDKTPKRKERRKKYMKEYRQTPRYKEHKKEYRKTLKYKEHKNEYTKERRKNNPKFRLDMNMGTLVWRSLKGKKAGITWKKLIGYSIEKLMKHLEKKFDDKMSWDNYGSYWWIDHKKARSLFHYTCPEDPQFKECWALKNLQPLESIENIKKGNKY